MSQGIAITGMACRYPGARTPAELWENVLARRKAFRRMPPERLRLEDYLTLDPADPDGIYSTEAAVLEDWEFDRVRFRVAGGTYRAADLAHWLALEVASQALAEAGFPDARGLPRDAFGVLVGNSLTGEFSRANLMRQRWPYVRRVLAAALREEGWEDGRVADFLADLEATYKAPFPPPSEESLAGGLSNTIAGRICNHFDLHGGGFTVDGACASSLLAVAQSCSALAAGDLDVALAGGVDLSLDPFELVGFARTGALTRGEMRVFDARSSGFIPGEGCGFVLLMREEDAARLGCRVHAVLRGWGISSDGSGGISRPEAEGQKMALRRAYRRAGFGIGSVGYFEGHGTGTAVGDAAELRALSEALREAGAEGVRPVGSIKALFGHTKAAAGVAGLLKATMALEHQVLPPNAGCDEPHGELTCEGSPLTVLDRGEAWPAGRPLRAAASAMGFGGINVHVVLEGTTGVRRRSLAARERALLASSQDAELILLDAPDTGGLTARVERLLETASRISRSELTDLAAVLQSRLTPGGQARAAIVAATPKELAERLERLAGWLKDGVESRIEPALGIFLGIKSGLGAQARRVGFLFPGQGSPSHLSGGALRRRFEDLESIYGSAGMFADSADADPIDTSVAQPAIVAHSLAGLAVLDRLGIRAAVAVGHSLGELTALAWAGSYDEETAVRLAAARGRAMADLSAPTGSMASLGAPPEAVEALLATGTGVAIAGLNSPRRTVVSGPAAAVEAVAARAAELGYEVHRLRVSHAFHSPLVAEAAPALARHLEGIAIGRPARPVASTVTGDLLGPSDDLRELLTRQVTAPVRFTAALAAARGLADLWIEAGPGRALSELAAESLDCPVIALDSGGPSLAGLLQAAGAAFALGVPVETAVLFEGRFVRPFDPERLPRFLASPCESAPVSPSSFSPPPRISDPVAPSSGEGVGEAVGRGSALDVVRQLVAAKAELPADAIQEDSRLLSDLHLNSISVGQLVAEAARQLGLRPPASPTDYSRATVAEVALALAAQEELAGAEAGGAPAGVDSWVRAFHTVWVPRELPRRRVSAAFEPGTWRGTWRILAPRDHPLAWKLAALLAGDGVLLCLPPRPDERHAGLFLEAASEVLAAEKPARFLVVHQGGGGAAFARTLHLEMPEVTTRVVDVLFDHPDAPAWVAAEAASAEGHAEARYDASGVRTVPVLRLLPDTEATALPLGPDDVLLVTGGGKGIGAECALDLALATGARLGLLGRSLPESDPELAANLERMRGSLATGAVLTYVSADVTDAAAVAEAVRRIESELGPVTAVLHGAGANTPRPIAALDEASFQRTLAPKVRGLENVLAAVDPDRLRLLVSFGSIIARAGLEGEADYATANEWLGLLTERFGREHPECRCLTLEWSVWSGVGMGERLGTLESLIRRGITPIPPGTGVARLRGLLSRSTSPASVVVAGRFGDPGTVEMERPELPLLRFLERPRAYYPGVELVVDSEISADTDPHLADHVFRGEPLFAAVLGMEAMAQAAMALAGTDRIPVFEDVQLIRPVAVPAGRSTTVRVAALVRGPGIVELVLRDASTGFATDHFRAVCRFDTAPDLSGGTRVAGNEPRLPLDPSDLYGGLLFHRGRFRRLEGYRHLEATACLAEIAADGSTAWFGKWLPPRLVLGDPGARDAAIHGIQACIPHATLLPTGVDRIVTGCLGASEPLVLSARERSRNGDDFVYDLDVLDAQGRVRERWEGLRLHAVQKIDPPAAWRAALLAPYVERRIEEILPGRHVRVSISRGGPDSSHLHHRPDGKPEAALPHHRQVSRSHAGELVLEVAGDGRIGCDLEPVTERSEEVWRDLLGDRFALAELIAAERGETRDTAATRVWTAVESLKKAGVPHGAPLVLDRALDDAETGGWLVLRSGDLRIGTFLGPVKELSGPAALAVLLESAG
jgi:enediyne polyketide synthase